MAFLRRMIDNPDDPYQPAPDPGNSLPPIETAPPPPTTGWTLPEPEPGPHNGGGNGGGGGPVYGGPVAPEIDLPGVPGFTPPPAFQAPDAAALLSSPGYQARLNAGNTALQHSQAAKGVTRTGGSLRDLIEYNQNFTGNEYDRDFSMAKDVYDRQYQSYKDVFAPKLAQYQTQSQAALAKALAAFQARREWEMYNLGHRGGGGGGGGNDDLIRDLNLLGPAPTNPWGN